MKLFSSLLFSSLVFLHIGCNPPKNDDVNPINIPNSEISVQLNHSVNGESIVLDTKDYLTPNGLPYQINEIKYFLSNFSFIKEDGSKYTIPQIESYFLIKEKKNETKTLAFTIPEGEYTKVEFMLGVDSLRNTMNISERQGVLDPTGAAQGMYWTWNSGYIHVVFEGSSREIPTDVVPSQKFLFHIGGFGGYNAPTPNNTRIIQLDLNANGKLLANSAQHSTININVDFNKFFNAVHPINIAETPLLMNDADGIKLADNAVWMFNHLSTEYYEK